jgi:CshA-type fibril repeat protein
MRRHKLGALIVTCLLLTTGVVAAFVPFNSSKASAIGLDLNFQSLSFQPEADLVSATSNLGPGFKRRYENVATIDGVVIDALVTIVSQGGNIGNELDTFDQYDNTQHLSAHTMPSSTAEAWGKIKVEFLADGTTTPVVLNNIRASIADIDGHEFGTFFGISSYRLSTGTQLSRSGTTAGIYRFHSSTTGTSNTDEKRIIEVVYDSTSSVVSSFGCRANASSVIGAGGKCGFTVVIGTFTRTLGFTDEQAVRPSYTITYNANSGTGAVPSPTTGTAALTVAGNPGSLSQGSNIFLGWNTLANGTGVSFPSGSTFVPTEDMTLYAQYGPPPTPPTADNETSTGAFDTDQLIDVLTGDAAGAGAALDPTSVRLCEVGTPDGSCTSTQLFIAGEGTYTVNQTTGLVTFNPLPTFFGPATTIKYVVKDTTNQVAAATISPTVANPTTPPTATPESKTVIPGGSVQFTSVTGTGGLGSAVTGLNASATCLLTPGTTSCDADGVVAISGEGTFTLNASTGVVTFVADAAATPGPKTSITYQITDNSGLQSTSTLTPVVPPPPTSLPDSSTGVKDYPQTLMPLNNDAPGDAANPLVKSSIKLCGTSETSPNCSQTVVTISGEGTYTVNVDGTILFEPELGYVSVSYVNNVETNGITSVPYTVLDSLGQKTASTLTPRVVPPPAPITQVDTGTATQGSVVELSPWLNDDPGVIPAGLSGTVELVPTSIRLCRPTDTPPQCSETSLQTSDGDYTVDVTTGRVTFVHTSGFVGTVTEPVTYIIANDWTGASGIGITTNFLIPTITAPTPPPTTAPRTPPPLSAPPSTPPTTSPTPSPVVAPVPAVEDPEPEATPVAEVSEDSGALPATGSSWTMGLGLIAAALFAVGAVLLLHARRKLLS